MLSFLFDGVHPPRGFLARREVKYSPNFQKEKKRLQATVRDPTRPLESLAELTFYTKKV